MKPNDYPYTNGHASSHHSSGNQSSEIATVPRSLREQLDQVQSLVSQGRQSQAASLLRAAEGELARTHPELFALLRVARLGYQGIAVTHTEVTHSHQLVERRFLGFVIDQELRPVTTVHSTTRTMRLF